MCRVMLFKTKPQRKMRLTIQIRNVLIISGITKNNPISVTGGNRRAYKLCIKNKIVRKNNNAFIEIDTSIFIRYLR